MNVGISKTQRTELDTMSSPEVLGRYFESLQQVARQGEAIREEVTDGAIEGAYTAGWSLGNLRFIEGKDPIESADLDPVTITNAKFFRAQTRLESYINNRFLGSMVQVIPLDQEIVAARAPWGTLSVVPHFLRGGETRLNHARLLAFGTSSNGRTVLSVVTRRGLPSITHYMNIVGPDGPKISISVRDDKKRMSAKSISRL